MCARDRTASSSRAPPPVGLILTLAAGTFAIGTSGPMIALALATTGPGAEAPAALAIAAWRTLLGGALFLGATLPTARAALGALRSARRRTRVRLALGAALLAIHFATWISAFAHTSFASAVLLMVLQPVFGALLDRVLFGHRISARMAGALVGSAVGLLFLVWPDLEQPGSLFGDVLAAVGALAMAVFYVVVRPVRSALPFPLFMGSVNLGAGALLAALAVAVGEPLSGYSDAAWGWIAALVLVPTAVGHACFNWALPRVRLFALNLLIVLEPAVALLIGIVALDSRPDASQWIGGAVLAGAVLLGLERRREREETGAQTASR